MYITDVNDNPPEFRQSPITVGVTRDTELGTFIANLQVCCILFLQKKAFIIIMDKNEVDE